MNHQEKNVRVLIAEDNYMVGETIKVMLEETEYVAVGKTMNGREAVEITQALRPDVVMGLTIVKEIMELHGGRVTVESEVDVGATFTVWLPLAKV